MEQLKRYLNTVSKLEVQLYEQQQLMGQISNRINSLGFAHSIQEPEKPCSLIGVLRDGWSDGGDGFLPLIPGAVTLAFFVIKLMYSVVVNHMSEMQAFDEFLWGAGIAIGVVIVGELVHILKLINYHSYTEQRYSQEMQNYFRAVEADRIRVQNELSMREYLCEQWNRIKADYDATRKTLDELYALDIVNKKYRNMPAVVFFYEYLDLQICTELTGPNGAYMKFEEALRFWNIENRLDIIISRLDTLIEKIDALSDMMNESNQSLHRIESKIDDSIHRMDRMEADNALNRYHEECTARNTEALRDMAFYEFIRQ